MQSVVIVATHRMATCLTFGEGCEYLIGLTTCPYCCNTFELKRNKSFYNPGFKNNTRIKGGTNGIMIQTKLMVIRLCKGITIQVFPQSMYAGLFREIYFGLRRMQTNQSWSSLLRRRPRMNFSVRC